MMGASPAWAGCVTCQLLCLTVLCLHLCVPQLSKAGLAFPSGLSALAQRLVSRQSLKNHMHTSTKKSIILFNNCIVCLEFAICEMEQVEKLVARWVLPLSFTCSDDALSSCSTPAARGGGLWLPPKSHPMQPGQRLGLCLRLGFSAPRGAPESPASRAPAAWKQHPWNLAVLRPSAVGQAPSGIPWGVCMWGSGGWANLDKCINTANSSVFQFLSGS